MSADLPSTATVSYFIDGQLIDTERTTPFWMGGQTLGSPDGFSVSNLGFRLHTLNATATLADGSVMVSNDISLNVIPSLNSHLSGTLAVYGNEPSAQQASLASILANVTTQGASLTPNEITVREAVLALYMNWGIDPSLDWRNDSSNVLIGLEPGTWKAPVTSVSSSLLSMSFSPDSPFYQPIPAIWPRVALPSGYFKQVQLNSAYGGDGIGFGQTVASASDPQRVITSEWYSDKNTLRTFPYRMKSTWETRLPTLTVGDSHLIFVDPSTNTFVSSYKTTMNSQTGGPNALYASPPTSFDSLGDHGGANAAAFSELPILIQPGEAINPTQPISHAIGGAVARTWAARVYPAIARDAGVLTSTNTCTGVGYTNTGLLPYGSVIQLDPQLDVSKLSVSLPARRILQAMQTYGYYVLDFGCADIDIYTAISESELEPYGGMYGNVDGPGVQNEVQNVLTANTLYVVAPLTKKQ